MDASIYSNIQCSRTGGNIPKFGFVLNDRVFSSIEDLRALANSLHPSSGASITCTMSGEPGRQSSVSLLALRQADHPHLHSWQAELISAVLIAEASWEHLGGWLPPRVIKGAEGHCMP